ncbi:hypothetical protein [Rhodanobacter fulvus]|uniref:hypothetical protein n=1 Tax=Rhodanobacter fulvus TaxID=219571 RepID=UPI001ED8DA1E|nr:hypothetical protein [Rhodanobacter fulvus]
MAATVSSVTMTMAAIHLRCVASADLAVEGSDGGFMRWSLCRDVDVVKQAVA